MFQLVLTLQSRLRERISKGITGQRKGPARIGNGRQKGLGRATLGLAQDHRAEPFPRRKQEGRRLLVTFRNPNGDF